MYGTVIGILDHDGTLLPDGSEGELGLAGPQGTIGYWHDPERNATAFVKPTNSTERYYRTGDRCVMDRDGDLLYLGRTDHQVKIQGFRVELVAVAVRDPLGNMELVLVVEGEPMDVPTISRALRTLVPTYMVPTRIRFRDDLPLNANGKIDRPALGEWIAMNT